MMPFTRQGLGVRSVSKCFKQCLTECAEHIPKRSKKLSLKWCQQWLLGSGGGGTCICERCGGATFPPTALIWPGVPDVGCLALKMSKKSVGGETYGNMLQMLRMHFLPGAFLIPRLGLCSWGVVTPCQDEICNANSSVGVMESAPTNAPWNLPRQVLAASAFWAARIYNWHETQLVK